MYMLHTASTHVVSNPDDQIIVNSLLMVYRAMFDNNIKPFLIEG